MKKREAMSAFSVFAVLSLASCGPAVNRDWLPPRAVSDLCVPSRSAVENGVLMADRNDALYQAALQATRNNSSEASDMTTIQYGLELEMDGCTMDDRNAAQDEMLRRDGGPSFEEIDQEEQEVDA